MEICSMKRNFLSFLLKQLFLLLNIRCLITMTVITLKDSSLTQPEHHILRPKNITIDKPSNLTLAHLTKVTKPYFLREEASTLNKLLLISPKKQNDIVPSRIPISNITDPENMTIQFDDIFVMRPHYDRRNKGILTALERLDYESKQVINQRQALIYIVVVISFYAATIIIVMIKYMKAESTDARDCQQFIEYRKMYERRPKQRQKQKWINYLVRRAVENRTHRKFLGNHHTSNKKPGSLPMDAPDILVIKDV